MEIRLSLLEEVLGLLIKQKRKKKVIFFATQSCEMIYTQHSEIGYNYRVTFARARRGQMEV
jgi:hypothetical protein